MIEKVNVLVVDDLKENHIVMEAIIDDDEINIVKAYSGEEALVLCTKHTFAVIFMDVQMPGMDGFETATLLRGIEKTKLIPIIFVTAISKEKKSIFKGYEVGAVDYMFKPVDPIILKGKVRIFKELYQQRMLIQRQADELKLILEELSSVEKEKNKLESISLEDSLTGIYNRRGVMKLLDNHIKNCSRYELPISILMFDVDRFKKYNDNYGHIKGDEILIEVAKCAKSVLYRAEDYVGRYGGEEFIIVMPNTDLSGAKKVANRLQEVLSAANIEHKYNDGQGKITVSSGIATIFPTPDLEITKFIHEADQMMYLSKKTGRNNYHFIMLEQQK